MDELSAVGHLMGHGGEYFDKSVIIDKNVMDKIYDTLDLVPLHGAAFVHGVEAVTHLLPNVRRLQLSILLFTRLCSKKLFLCPAPWNSMKNIASVVTVFMARRTVLFLKRPPKCWDKERPMNYKFGVYGDSIAFGYGNNNQSWFDELYLGNEALKLAQNGEKIEDVLSKIKQDNFLVL